MRFMLVMLFGAALGPVSCIVTTPRGDREGADTVAGDATGDSDASDAEPNTEPNTEPEPWAVAGFWAAPRFGGLGTPTTTMWSWAFTSAPPQTPECRLNNGIGAVNSSESRVVTLAEPTVFELTCLTESEQVSATFASLPLPSMRFKAVAAGGPLQPRPKGFVLAPPPAELPR